MLSPSERLALELEVVELEADIESTEFAVIALACFDRLDRIAAIFEADRGECCAR